MTSLFKHHNKTLDNLLHNNYLYHPIDLKQICWSREKILLYYNYLRNYLSLNICCLFNETLIQIGGLRELNHHKRCKQLLDKCLGHINLQLTA